MTDIYKPDSETESFTILLEPQLLRLIESKAGSSERGRSMYFTGLIEADLRLSTPANAGNSIPSSTAI